jgi:hypothetical protein
VDAGGVVDEEACIISISIADDGFGWKKALT